MSEASTAWQDFQAGMLILRSNQTRSVGRNTFVLSNSSDGGSMARRRQTKYTAKQKRKAHDIEKGYKKRGVSRREAERRAWATVNKSDRGGGKKAEVAAVKCEANRVLAKVAEKAAGSKA